MQSCATPRSSALIWATTMLEIAGLCHSYGRHAALRDVAIRVGDREVVAILGANGAGKTTLLNAIAGLLRPSGGSIRYRDTELIGLRAHQMVKLGIAAVTETRHLFGAMSVTDNLFLGAYSARAREAAEANLARVFDLFPRLAERKRQAVCTMSGGEQQMVAVGRALMARPSLLLLDEPSLGLAPLIAGELFAALQRIRRESETSIVIVEQNARRALKMADRAYLLALGRIVGEGTAKSLAQDKAVAESYLGL
jgi:ABC-type branched-subunit amino acid transport system ATPase component